MPPPASAPSLTREIPSRVGTNITVSNETSCFYEREALRATNASLEQRIEQLKADNVWHFKQSAAAIAEKDAEIARLDNALIENRGNMSRCMEARQDEENMHAKVLAEKDAEIARLQKEFANVSRLHGRLREALEWYTNEINYADSHETVSFVQADAGKRARLALTEEA